MSADILKVAALTGGQNIPSARLRVRQLIPALRRCGVDMQEIIPSVSRYPPVRKWLRPFWGGAALAIRAPAVLATHRYDIAFLQRELISTLLTLEPLTKHPRVLDVDDAIFLHQRGRSIERLARQCDLVICGNNYLAEQFSLWNENIAVIPTAVDTVRYVPKDARHQEQPDQEQPVIGWIGTSENLKYVYEIELALRNMFEARPDAVLRVIADSRPRFGQIPEQQVDYIRWSPEKEVEDIQGMAIGIMPLPNSPWERGKCSYKMLQYMACGVPVVVSPVGMNTQVLALGQAGIAATGQPQWVDALLGLLSDSKMRETMGKTGRLIVEKHFSINVIAPRIARSLGALVS